jgi:KUP system potassium uptake protein
MALGLFPRVRVVHTNPDMEGQVYLPFINLVLLLGTSALVIGFRSSSALAAAYGLAVTGTMVITTLAFGAVARRVWGWRRVHVILLIGALLSLDLAFFGANAVKFLHGGWVPIVIGGALFAVMDTWRWGRQWIRLAYERKGPQLGMTVEALIQHRPEVFESGPSVSLVVMASRPITRLEDRIPPVMAVHHNNWKRLPKHVIFFSIRQVGRPEVPLAERYEVIPFVEDELGTVVSVLVTFGYMEQPNVRKVLRELKETRRVKIPQAPQKWLILIGAERFVTQGRSWRERWRLALFSKLNRLSKPVTDYFGLETDTGVTMETINV